MKPNTNKSDACAEPSAGLLSVEQARERIAAITPPLTGTETLPIRTALDRVLAQGVVSTIDVPPYDNSAMDGYALRSEDLDAAGSTALRVVGTAMAGAPFAGKVGAGDCARIMTGAVIPPGADTVIMQEQVQRDDDTITVHGTYCRGENVRRAGEDMARGAAVLMPGKRLLAAELGLLASLGIGEVDVFKRLRVTFFSTGDELRSVGETLEAGQIYDSNRYTLHGMLARLGVDITDMGVIRDRRDAVQEAFRTAAANADVVITSGGVSVGEADFVKHTLDEMGQVDFWKIAMKPGKPLAFGTVDKAVFFGLPGNPVSVMATFYQFVQPALRRMQGETDVQALTMRVPCATALKKQPGRTEFQRGVLTRTADGNFIVSTTGLQGSHVLSSMSRANCFVILPAESAGVAAGELVEVQPFAGLV